MKRAIIGLACLSVLTGIAMATRIATQAGAIGAGYAAKQICSGVFVARLPERFIVETDVLPRLATVSPLHHLLTYQLNVDERMVTARMLGQQIRVQHRFNYGCTVLTGVPPTRRQGLMKQPLPRPTPANPLPTFPR